MNFRWQKMSSLHWCPDIDNVKNIRNFTLRTDGARLRGQRVLWSVLLELRYRNDSRTFWHSFHHYTLCLSPLSPSIRFQSRKIANFGISVLFYCFFKYESTCDLQISGLYLWSKTGKPTFWHYRRHSTIFLSRALTSQRLKCANLAQREPTGWTTEFLRKLLRKRKRTKVGLGLQGLASQIH